MRADKFLYHHARLGRRAAREAIAHGKMLLNGELVREASEPVSKFDNVILDGEILQQNEAVYLMLNKPKGVVCATIDALEKTVIDLLKLPNKETFHLAGRLDKNTSGLVLITNDGQWSRYLTEPSSKKPKVYVVETESDITAETQTAFKKGILFEKEKVVTHPALVEMLDSKKMRLTIYEGMHHQIKRMFLKYKNRVLELHREEVAGMVLDIEEGDYRPLRAEEIQLGKSSCSRK